MAKKEEIGMRLMFPPDEMSDRMGEHDHQNGQTETKARDET